MAQNLKLSTEVKRLTIGARALSARPIDLPARLREHGAVSLDEAARLLSLSRPELDGLLGTELPRLESGRLPLSELRRCHARREARKVSTLQASPDAAAQARGRRTLDLAAAALGIGEREAMRLVETGELYATPRAGRWPATISDEEIEAFRATRVGRLLGRLEPAQPFSSLVSGDLDAAFATGPSIRRRGERRAA